MEKHLAEHNLVATYPSLEEARAALLLLERKGVEAGDMELFGPGVDDAGLPTTNDEQRAADERVIGRTERRVGGGLVVGALVGAAVGLVLGWLVFGVLDVARGVGAGGVLGATVAGAVFGSYAGFYYGAIVELPVSDAWGESFIGETGPTSLAVHTADAAEVDSALQALRGTSPMRLATCGRDGNLREVA